MSETAEEMIDWSIPEYSLDHSRIVDRTQIDLKTYERKFELFDKAAELKLWNRPETLKLLTDPTIFMYAFYKIRHRWYQDMIVSDPYRFKIFCAANQIGKSYLLNTAAIYTFLKDHGHGYNRAIVSKSLKQAVYQMARIKNILRSGNVNWREHKGDTDNVMVISLNKYHEKTGEYKDMPQKKRYKYTNYLIVAPCTEGILGYDLHEVDLDEMDFWEEDPKNFFYQYAQPRTYETQGKLNIYSNPNGKEGFMYELWNQKLPNGRHKWHRYQFNIWDKPKFDQKQYDEITVGMSRRQIESTLLGIYTSAEGSYFSYEDVVESEDKKLNEYSGTNKQTFWFLDPGSSVDHSALTGCYLDKDDEGRTHVYEFIIHEYPLGYPMSRVVGVYSPDQDNDGWHHEKSVREYLKEHTVGGFNPIFDCDVSKNDSLTALFHTVKVFPQELLNFSGPKKYAYYENLNYMIQRRPILFHRKSSKKFLEQATNIEIKGRAAGGYLMLHATRDEIHDDIMDSTVACVYLATNAQIKPGLTIVTGDGGVINSNMPDYKKRIDDSKSDQKKRISEGMEQGMQKIGQVKETIHKFHDRQTRLKRMGMI